MALLDPQFHGTPRFRIVSRIGVDAVGELYKALDEARGTFVALRTLRNAGRGACELLRRDFAALKAVRNPSLVALGDLDCSNGQCFYTMELVEGESLLSYVRAREPQQPDAAGRRAEPSELRLRSAFTQLVRAVHALHRAGRVHGHIELDHLRVTAQGRLVLLACELSGFPDDRMREQRLLRALPYVAPERLEGAPASPEADWYSVGAVLYEALTGVAPFSATGADLLDQKHTEVPELPDEGPLCKLAKLARELLAIDPDARPDYDEIRAQLGIAVEGEPTASHTLSLLGDAAHFLGRRRELALLADAFTRTRDGATSILCLHGEAGVGKRALAAQLARKLRKDYPHLVHLSGRCEPEGPRAFRGVSGLVGGLSRYLAQHHDDSSLAMLLPPHADLLPRLFPALLRLAIPDTNEPPPCEPRALRRVALQALRSLLRDLAKRAPMLVIVEDAQWADGDALSVLDELVRAPDAPNMLLLLLVQGELEQVERAFREWLARHDEQVTPMRLKELAKGAAGELAQSLLRSGAVYDLQAAQRVASDGAGHPLRTDALARHFLVTGACAPPELTLEDLLWVRAMHVPLEARELLIALCHARIAVPAEVLARATGLSIESVTRHTASLQVAKLARVQREPEGERYLPGHAAVRQAVCTRASVDRKRIHHQLALAMAAWPRAPADVLAAHFLEAGDARRASQAMARAADQARDSLAFEAAVQLYRNALGGALHDAQEERRLRVELARAYASAGQAERAARAYLETARDSAATEALELERDAAFQLLRAGLIHEGLDVIERVLERLDVKLPRSPAAAVISLLRHRLALSVRGFSFERCDVSQVAPHDRMRADILGSLVATFITIDSLYGADAQTRYLLLSLKLGDPVRVARALAREAGLRLLSAEPARERWLPPLERAEALAKETGDPEAQGHARAVRAMAAFLLGSLRESIRHAAEAERILHTQCAHLDWTASDLRVLQCMAGLLLGELKLQTVRIQRELRDAETYGERYAHTNMLTAVGCYPLLMADRPRQALALLERASPELPDEGFTLQRVYHLSGMLQVDLYTGQGKPYSRLMAVWPQLSKALLVRTPAFSHMLRHLRARAGIAQACTDPEERELLLRDAADSAAKLIAARVAYAVGWGHASRAGVDAARGDRKRAVQRLEQAEEAFYESEMTLYAAATRYQLGRMLGGARGRTLRDHAQAWFEAEEVRQPEKYIAMLLPGFE